VKKEIDELINIDSISKSFQTKDSNTEQKLQSSVLENITFPIKKGKFVCLFGPNGCGKTTFLKILAGLEKPDKGRVDFVGKERHQINAGMVFQNYRDSLFPWKHALDNVAFPLELKGIPKEKRRAKARELLDRVGEHIFTKSEYNRYPYQLSGGQQQLITIARALIDEPDLLLMDESFAALDHDTRYLIQDILVNIWEEMKFFIVFISHSVWEAVYLADYVVLFSRKPARVLEIVDIPLPRPRNREVEYMPEFFELRSKILRVFESELYGK
jgi:NitT/TauT family transport system ATP-binding protein